MLTYIFYIYLLYKYTVFALDSILWIFYARHGIDCVTLERKISLRGRHGIEKDIKIKKFFAFPPPFYILSRLLPLTA